jgi:hypothetical protein
LLQSGQPRNPRTCCSRYPRLKISRKSGADSRYGDACPTRWGRYEICAEGMPLGTAAWR